MKQFLRVTSPSLTVELRSIDKRDLENLRVWKNNNREFFFHQSFISAEQQAVWFERYLLRDDDYMFMVTSSTHLIGCLAVRKLDDVWDVYNVMLGDPASKGKGLMSCGLKLLIAFANSIASDLPITLKVLRKNPATSWYLKNGFEVRNEAPDHFFLAYPVTVLPKVNVSVQNA